MNRERLAMLDAAQKEAGDSAVPLRRVIQAILVPQRRVAIEHPEFIGFLVRMRNYPNPEFHRLINSEFKVSIEGFNQALRGALPPMSDFEFNIKIFFFLQLLDSVPENDFHLNQLIPGDLKDEAVTEIFLSFLEGGLSSALVASPSVSPEHLTDTAPIRANH